MTETHLLFNIRHQQKCRKRHQTLWNHLANIYLVFIGKMFNAMNFGAIFNYAAELYPTNMRSTAVGFTSSMARIGGLLAPQLNLLATIDKRLPVLVIG